MATKYLSTAERNRIAKLKFFNESNEANCYQRNSSHRRSLPTTSSRFQRLDITIPGTPVSSKYLSKLKEQQEHQQHQQQNHINDCANKNEYVDPFAVFLNSMKKLNDGELKPNDGKDILDLFVKLEKIVEKKEFGYNNIGVLNGESNLRPHPAVRRSLSRRQSLQENLN